MKEKKEMIDITENPLYHDTWKLLKKYRDVVWSLELSVQQVRNRFEIEYGSVLQSPIYIGKQVLDSINSMAPFFTQYILEGINDGSIHVKNPKQTAETMILLLNIWLSPLIFPDTKEDYMEKYEHLKLMYEGIGLPVFDDEMQMLVEKLYDGVAAYQ